MEKYARLVALISLLSPTAAQCDWRMDWNGFGTVAVSQFKKFDEINGSSRLPYGDFSTSTSEKTDTKFALQGSAHLNDSLSASVQVISRAKHDYELDLEWAYLRYQLTSELTLRAGRIKRHGYLHSDNYDISYSYVWVRPPTSAYLTIGPIYQAIEAVDLYYQNSAKNFDYSAQIYVGKAKDSAEMFGVTSDYEEHLATGITFLFETESSEFHLSHHRSNFDLEYPQAAEVKETLTALGYAKIADNYDFNDRDAIVNGLGVSTTHGNWDFTAEYVHSDFDEAQIPTLKGWYASVSKHVGKLSLYGGYGVQSTEVSQKLENDIQAEALSAANAGGFAGLITSAALNTIADAIKVETERQHIDRRSIQVGMRYEILPSANIKLEYEKLKNRLNNAEGSLYTVSLDFIF